MMRSSTGIRAAGLLRHASEDQRHSLKRRSFAKVAAPVALRPAQPAVGLVGERPAVGVLPARSMSCCALRISSRSDSLIADDVDGLPVV